MQVNANTESTNLNYAFNQYKHVNILILNVTCTACFTKRTN